MQSANFLNNQATGRAVLVAGNNGPVTIYKGSDPLERLPRAKSAAFDSDRLERERLCLPQTRVEILDALQAWIDGPAGEPLFWLRGMAGMGKSTIARTVARRVAQAGQLGASFFFARGGADLERSDNFVTTLAYQLALWNSQLGDLIRAAIETAPNLAEKAKKEQWSLLIQQPLKRLKKDAKIVLVIDALDESGNADDIALILSIFADQDNFTGTGLKIFLTSRPEAIIAEAFALMEHSLYKSVSLQDTDKRIAERDMKIFFSHEFDQIRRRKRLAPDFPGEEAFHTLTERAGGLFIYAATVCLFVGDRRLPKTERRLQLILNNEPSSALRNLDGMYTQILRQAAEAYDAPTREEFYDLFRLVMGVICSNMNRTSLKFLTELLGLDQEELECILQDLKSVIVVPLDNDGIVTFLHPSFRDYLGDDDRCPPEFLIHPTKAYSNFVISCLDFMSRHLKRNICNLDHDGILVEEIDPKRIEECIGPTLADICVNWVLQFLFADKYKSEALMERARMFVDDHLYHWLEAVCILGDASSPTNLAVPFFRREASLGENLEDKTFAKIFLLQGDISNIWRRAPLQIYSSALIFRGPMVTSLLGEEHPAGGARIVSQSAVPAQPLSGRDIPIAPNGDVLELEIEQSKVTAVAFVCAGKAILCSSTLAGPYLFDLRTRQYLTLNDSQPWISAKTIANGKLLIAGELLGRLVILNLVRLTQVLAVQATRDDGKWTLTAQDMGIIDQKLQAICETSADWPNLEAIFDDKPFTEYNQGALSFTYNEENKILTKNGERWLFLPHSLDITCLAAHDNLLAFGSSSGQLTIMDMGASSTVLGDRVSHR